MSGRRRNPRQAKTLLCYSIADAADLYGVHRQTVRHWLSSGLAPIDASRPILIHGSTLNAFHASRRAAAKRPCGLLELFCLSCRAPRRPAGDMADYRPMTANLGTISGICPMCGRMMTQRINATGLARFRVTFEVSIRRAPEPIRESR